MKSLVFLLAMIMASSAAAASLSGELRKWHKVTLSFDGPNSSESATPNPFTNYRLDVTFRHAASGKVYRVPGYYAADGNAANTSATSGDVWRVHFAPDETGTWTWNASFRSGSNVAMADLPDAGSSAGFFDGDSGSFPISATDKTGRDFRGKGRLQYVDKHHLRFAESGRYFMKAGVDAPENLLAYTDFDGEFKTDGREDDYVRPYTPHIQDWSNGDPVWQGSKGKGLIGAVNYLADQGLNAFSFLTMNIDGDDKNVYPYTSYGERLRMDVSKLDQWEIVFEHGTRNGMYLHFKTQETENELMLDSGNLGNQRKLYYRELIARFGHHLALNWNLGEEINGASLQQKQAWAQYFYDNDPYRHHLVIHNGATHYNMMGDASKLTGFSLQLNAYDFTDNFAMTKDYIDRSVAAGKPWVVATDEPGDSRYSLRPDSDPGTSHTDARKDALWGNIMAGGAGVEFYFGYALEQSDLTCDDFRSRHSFWPFCRTAVQFFENNDIPFDEMSNANSLVSNNGNNANRCLAKPGDAYIVQLRSGGSHTLNLSGQSGNFRVRWLDPRNGGALISGPTLSGGGTRNLGSPPDSTGSDWIALVESTSGGTPTNEAPVVSAGSDKSASLSGGTVSVTLNGSASDDGLPSGSTLTRTWSRVSGPAAVSFSSTTSASTSATFTAAGVYVLRLSASDGTLNSSDEVQVTITEGQPNNQAPQVTAGPDRSATLSSGSAQIPLAGSASDDGLPTGSTLAVSWSSVSGPASVTFSNAASSNSAATFSAVGTYVLRLTATDGSLSASDETTVVISSSGGGGTTVTVAAQDAFLQNGSNVNNADLRVENSSRKRISYLQFDTSGSSGPFTSATLTITQRGDVPSGKMQLRLFATSNNWNEATITGSNAPAKGAEVAAYYGDIPAGVALNFDVSSVVTAPGIYSFILDTDTSRDVTFASSENTLLSARPVLTTTGSGGAPANAAPVVSAGPDRSGSYRNEPVSIPITGSASDDGLPQGSTLSLSWTMVSGPAPVSFSPANAAATNATFNAAGSYVLRLSGSDGALASSDQMTIDVVADIIDNEIPTVSAGPDQAATLSGSAVSIALNGSASDDGQPAGSTLVTTWSRVSGPGAVTFADPASATTTATFSTAGTYVLRLTASDGELSESDEMSVVIEDAAPGGGSPVTFAATHDAYTENGSRFNSSLLRLENSSRKRIIYLQFDTRGVGAVTAPELKLTQSDDVSSGSMTLRLYAATSNSWTESTITGTNAPAKGPQLAVFTGDISKGKVLSFDVSSHVGAGAIYSFILEADSSSLDVSFASAENSATSARPSLIATSSAAGAAPLLPGAGAEDPGGFASMLSSIERDAAGQITLTASGTPGYTYAVQRSTDLIEWFPMGLAEADAEGRVRFEDSAPPQGSAYYRLTEP
ncbi:DNRLRE domain-containing protein [Luteolibacter sp. GHJ8]|uniref:DNRLRE domain-containing protein n=1 Tax=Luteolibacter rhizosphaerae TaxID=2989719 RepID=A0ABT3G2P0_9BACT|nr:DNRLRE domain-containing protein [Luteolibacter rhizosphaerae]MCW1914108.1 DNRLRE domain-containing protein [Luteolibacter rhizosphaerae]